MKFVPPYHYSSFRYQFGLGFLVMAWGGQAIIVQSILVRESLVVMFGSELAWGMVLFAWLGGVAVGGALAGKTVGRFHHVDMLLVILLTILSLTSLATLWFLRGALGWLGVMPGEVVPLSKVMAVLVLLVFPVGFLVGFAFPLACRCQSEAGGNALGRIYALEAAGSLIGGAAFSFWAVEKLFAVQILLLCGAVTLTGCGILQASRRTGRFRGFILGCLAGAMIAMALGAGKHWNRQLAERRWHYLAPGYQLRSEVETRYQNLALGQRADQYALYGDGQISAAFPDPHTFVPLAHFWMCQHPAPRRILIIGGGAEGLLAEVLRHINGLSMGGSRDESCRAAIDYVEPDSRQIDLIRTCLSDADQTALRDPRVFVIHEDARFFVKTQRDVYDLVIARLPEPTSILRARFYTEEFYGELRRAMTTRSVLCMTASAAPSRLSDAAAEYLSSLRATLRLHFPELLIGWGEPALILAATAPDLVSVDASVLKRRYGERHVQSTWFDPLWFDGAVDLFEPEKLRQRAADLDAASHVEVSTDLRPILCIKRLILWERMSSPLSSVLLDRLRSVRLTTLVAAIGAVAVMVFLALPLCVRGFRALPAASVGFSMATTGFACMALSLMLLFAFQNLYGYVYQRIGWIVALFMAGLVIGCELIPAMMLRFRSSQAGQGQADQRAWRCLIGVDLALALLAGLVWWLVPVLGAMQTTRISLAWVELSVSIMVTLAGILGGASFAFTGRLQSGMSRDIGSAAGTLIWADHAGACAGALVTGTLLIPVFGIPTTATVLIGMKTLSAMVVVMGGWFPGTRRMAPVVSCPSA